MSARFEELDRASRERRLTTIESLELERGICVADRQRSPHGLTRALAREGVKRSGRKVH